MPSGPGHGRIDSGCSLIAAKAAPTGGPTGGPAGAATQERAAGFAPIVDRGVTTLVLGSLPSRRSIEIGQYYGHPQNGFWRIMGRLVDAGPERAYGERTERLLAAGIGVWDVLQSSIRPGSMDADIDLENAKPNDFKALFGRCPEIRRVCFNGRKAAELYKRFGCPVGAMGSEAPQFVTLPSTSPAHASMPFEEKLARWSIVTKAHATGR